MSDLLTTTSIPSGVPDTADIAAVRATVIGNRVNIATAAAAFDVCERSIYEAIERHNIPFVKVFNQRWLDPEDLKRALVERNTAPRGRGRPRKAA